MPAGARDGPISVQIPSGTLTAATEFTVLSSGGNQPPTILFDSPSPGQVFAGPTSILVGATARDSDGGIKRAEFYLGDTLLYGADIIPFSTVPIGFTWKSVPVGTHTIVAAARDNSDAWNFSRPLTIIVGGGALPRPAIQIGRSGSNVVLTWPTNAAGFVLETTSSLSLAPAWTPVSASPSMVGDQYHVTEPAGSASKFYRLRRAP